MMKFLIFNITVAAALIFLFTTDRGEVTSTAGRIHDAASEVKDAAHRAVEGGRRWVGRASARVGGDIKDAAARAAKPLQKHEILKTTPMAPPVIAPAVKSETEAGAEAMATVKVETENRAGTVQTPETAAAAPAMPKPPALPPAAAPVPLAPEQVAALKRREEILRGIDPKILAPADKAKAAPEAVKGRKAPTMSPT
ncbi:MAG: hypothetical protein OEO83_16350, partial [Alphaproteobacteria bacterium]|nr:hypothetical protein [Alphaproteobacteria bacterium]